ncbi:putative T6SS immunity periplasmic lipoprotein [Scandinavium goeteborgense]|uniref:putative T6SS immunity periplasmic lipoprotein n=1 Tax=Scandinavium goeteborgense TaxID=1851514 RepID=UPI0038109480
MNNLKLNFLYLFLLSSISLLLTGCPGVGDRLTPDETTTVELIDGNVCFLIDNPRDYQPQDMGINPRGIPLREKKFILEPDLTISEGKLCVPPAFYHFPKNGKFIAEYILASNVPGNDTRKFVVGIGITNGHVYNFPLTSGEITRPSTSIKK